MNPNFEMPVEEMLKEMNIKTIDDESTVLRSSKKKGKVQHDHTKPDEELIMKVDPEKFQKKDHIFMHLFSLYGKNFIDEKRDEKPRMSSH